MGTAKKNLKALRFDPVRFRLIRGEMTSEELTSREYRILSLFYTNNQISMRREVIEAAVWSGEKVGPKTLAVHFTHLRKKVRELGLEINYDPRTGYQLILTNQGEDSQTKVEIGLNSLEANSNDSMESHQQMEAQQSGTI